MANRVDALVQTMKAASSRTTINRLLAESAGSKLIEIYNPLRLGSDPSNRNIPPREGIHSHTDAFPTLGEVWERGIGPRVAGSASRIKARLCRERSESRANQKSNRIPERSRARPGGPRGIGSAP